MAYCNICGRGFYVEEAWTGGEWRVVLYNDRERSPDEAVCVDCPMFLPLEENVRDGAAERRGDGRS